MKHPISGPTGFNEIREQGWSSPLHLAQYSNIKSTPKDYKSHFQARPKVAVLLATYNGIKFLEVQLNSILNQTEVEVTLFISDDFSTDGTWEYLNEVKSKQVVLLDRVVNYKSASGNFFRLLREVDFSNFDYVSLSDQDDIWFKDKLITSITELKNQNAAACSSDVIAFWDDLKKEKQKYIRKARPMGKWNHLFESAGPGCTYVATKQITLEFVKFLKDQKVDLSHVKNTHDWVLFSFVVSNNNKWIIIGSPTMLYRQHSQNAFGANSGFKGVARRLKMLLSGWYINEVQMIASVCNNLKTEPLLKIDNMSFSNLIFLIKEIKHMRRKQIDRMVLAIYFIYLYLKKDNIGLIRNFKN